MDVEMHGCLRLALVGVPAGHAHGAIRERHQHAALNDAAAVVMLVFRFERVEVAIARWPRPERADQPDEAVVAIRLPAGGGRIEAAVRNGARTGRSLGV